MKLKKLTAAILAIAMTATLIPYVTAEGYLSVTDVMKTAEAVSEANSEESPAEDFEYWVNDEDVVTIIRYVGSGGNVVIPSEIEGKKVTVVGKSAFNDCLSLSSVEIPSTVTEIGNNAFSGCVSLTSVEIPNSVTRIENRAFFGCSSLISVTIPDSVTVIEHEVFEGCASITSVEIPNGITKIGYKAFYKCSSLASVNIPNSVTEIEFFAFAYCNSLTLIEIPDSVTKIGNDAFSDCDSLTSINVDEKNTSFSSSDGVLFNKDKTSLIQYPISKPEKRYSIPNSVIVIEQRAFSYSKFLGSVEIPDSVIKIGTHAFINCEVLASAIILNSKVLIDDSAFASHIYLTLYSGEGSTAQAYAENELFVFFKALGKEAAIDIETGILIENPDLEGTTFKAEKSADSTEEKMIFNITLKNKDGNEIQPEGHVTVKIPLPEKWDGTKTIVNRHEADGTYTDMKATCENGYMVFVTDHFSEYILSVKPDVKIADLNSDGKISTVDAKWVLQAVSGSRTLTPEQEAAADVNGDGKITTVDAKWILQAVSGSRDLG